jgi:hypothetical protein
MEVVNPEPAPVGAKIVKTKLQGKFEREISVVARED